MRKEVKVGLMAFIAMVILYFGVSFLKGEDFFSGQRTYYVTYDRVEGLMKSNPVMMNGFNVGRVENIEILGKENDYALRVTLSVKDNVQIGDKTKAILSSPDLLGGKAIVLDLGENTELYSGGEELISEIETSITGLIQKKALPVMDKTDELIVSLNQAFDEDFDGSLQRTMQKLEVTVSNFEKTSESFARIGKRSESKFESITNEIMHISDSLKIVLGGVNSAVSGINEFADKMNKSKIDSVVLQAEQMISNLDAVSEKLKGTDGTLGSLINDKRLYENLNSTIKSLNELSDHLQRNPRHFFKPLGEKCKGPDCD